LDTIHTFQSQFLLTLWSPSTETYVIWLQQKMFVLAYGSPSSHKQYPLQIPFLQLILVNCNISIQQSPSLLCPTFLPYSLSSLLPLLTHLPWLHHLLPATSLCRLYLLIKIISGATKPVDWYHHCHLQLHTLLFYGPWTAFSSLPNPYCPSLCSPKL